MLEDWQGVHTPGILYEFQNKGLTKLAFRKLLILNGAFSVDGSKWEDTGEKKNGTTASAGAGVNRRTPERRLLSEYYNRSERVGQGKKPRQQRVLPIGCPTRSFKCSRLAA